MNKNIKKGTLVFEYREGEIYAFHLIVDIKNDKFTRLEFTKIWNLNTMMVYTDNIKFFEDLGLSKPYSYKYINKE